MSQLLQIGQKQFKEVFCVNGNKAVMVHGEIVYRIKYESKFFVILEKTVDRVFIPEVDHVN